MLHRSQTHEALGTTPRQKLIDSPALLLVLPLVLLLLPLPTFADSPDNVLCQTGTAIPRQDLSIPPGGATGGYGVPEVDAERLINGNWDGWAPNLALPGEARAIIELGGIYTLTGIVVFTDNTSGVLEVSVGATGTFQPLPYNTASSPFVWIPFPVTGTVDRIEVRRDSPLDNVIELGVCYGAPSLPQLSISGGPVTEGSGPVPITVTLSSAASSVVTVDYATANGTAFAGPGLDYLDTSGTLMFQPGDVSESFDVPIEDNSTVEPSKSFFVNLSSASSNATIGTGQVEVTINDDDNPPVGNCNLLADNSSVSAGLWDPASSWLTLTTDPAVIASLTGIEVTLDPSVSGAIGNVLEVYPTWGSATVFVSGGVDTNTVVPVPSGAVSGSQLIYRVIHPQNTTPYLATVGLCTGSSTPTINIGPGSGTEGPGTIEFPVTLSAASSTTVTVAYETQDITALDPGDYIDKAGFVTFAPNDTNESIFIDMGFDSIPEATETFRVQLSNPSSNAALGNSAGIGTIFDDDGPTNCTYDSATNLQGAPPDECGVTVSGSFGDWAQTLESTSPGALTVACVRLHDRYWTLGPNSVAYHTWHPAAAQGCQFGHEHGDNPFDSDVFAASGGWPPFAYVMDVGGPPRHEDHFGHKVTVKNDYKAAFGNSANGPDSVECCTPQEVDCSNDPALCQPGQESLVCHSVPCLDTNNSCPTKNYKNLLHDTGFECDFLSKIHQGSHSTDAFPNHLHEYFLTVQCTDSPATDFSIKTIVAFGKPEEFNSLCPAAALTNSTGMTGLDGLPLANLHRTTPIGNNPREFSCFGEIADQTPSANQQVDLWTQVWDVTGPGGSVFFGPYYVVKNPSRLYEPNGHKAERTIERCYDFNTTTQQYDKRTDPYCTDVPATKPTWNDPASPFNGAIRAVNFKDFPIYNQGGTSNFCTHPYGVATPPEGFAPYPAPCNLATSIPQFVAPINNGWQTKAHFWTDSQNVQHFEKITGSLLNATAIACDPNGAHIPAGIGREKTIDYSAEPGLRGLN